MKKPWLIQRGKIKARSKSPIKENVDWSYMGSSYFETGILGRSFRFIRNCFEYYKLTVVDIKNIEGNPLYVFHSLTQQEFPEYLEYLKLLAKDALHPLDEPAYFHQHIIPSTYSYDHMLSNYEYTTHTDLWFDLDNVVIFSFDKKFMKRLPIMCQKSFEIMAGTK